MTRIAFDTTQKERGRIFDNYTEVKSILEKLNYICEEYSNFPITYDNICNYKVLIFACPDNSRLNFEEIDALKRYVNVGNNIILLSHAGGDRGRRTNLNNLSEIFGIKFNNNQVFDEENNLDFRSFPLVSTHSEYYSDVKIEEICHRSGCSLNLLNGTVLPLAETLSSATPDNVITAAISEYGKGRVICIGSYEIFRDEVKGGITFEPNLQFFNFIIDLLTQKELKTEKTKSEKVIKKKEKVITNKKQDSIKSIKKSDTKQNTNFNEFKEQVYQLLEHIKLNYNQIKDKMNGFNKNINQLIDSQKKLEMEYKNISEKVLNLEIDFSNQFNEIDKPGLNYGIIHDGLTEFKLEIDFINKKLDKLENEQKIINKRIENKMKIFNERENMIDNNIEQDEIVFIKASDLVGSQKKNHNPTFSANMDKTTSVRDGSMNNRRSRKDLEREEIVLDNSGENAKLKQFKKFLNFLKKQYDTGFINQDEYLEKKKKIECKIEEFNRN
ncbi:MAG: hypothetical protein GF329_13835 [Candidatus Lokiarchaeota archaeon]|nr:hypothetical protein [Candidatus Lokiarchaeota archaeon]